jgi:hypothetical protein
MFLLSDIITYVRRIVKTPSNSSLTDNLIIDYINRFLINDLDLRMQLFDFKTKYQFETIPQVCDYNMPMYSVQTEPGSQTIGPYPVYQGFTGTCYVNGIQIPLSTQRDSFWKIWPNYLQALTQVAIGNGSQTTFQFNVPYFPSIPGHIDMTGIVYSGNTLDPIFSNSIPTNPSITGTPIIPASSVYPGVFITYQNANGGTTTITDSGIFLANNTTGQLYGLLIQYQNPGSENQFPFGYSALGSNTNYSITSNTINYMTGQVNVTFPAAPLANSPIQVQSYYYQQGIPRAILYYNNCLTIRPPPNIPYLIELDAYLTPAAFLNTSQSIQFGYMTEFLARGAARKILSDTGDIEQFQFYEPMFREQELLVWKRSQRQITANRTGTIYSDLQGPQSALSGIGQGAT